MIKFSFLERKLKYIVKKVICIPVRRALSSIPILSRPYYVVFSYTRGYPQNLRQINQSYDRILIRHEMLHFHRPTLKPARIWGASC